MIYCVGVVGDCKDEGVAGDTTRLLPSLTVPKVGVLLVMLQVTSLARVVQVAHRVLVSLVMPTVRVSQVMLSWMALLVVL